MSASAEKERERTSKKKKRGKGREDNRKARNREKTQERTRETEKKAREKKRDKEEEGDDGRHWEREREKGLACLSSALIHAATDAHTHTYKGPDSDRLPTSHTCFNALLIPEVRTQLVLLRLYIR